MLANVEIGAEMACLFLPFFTQKLGKLTNRNFNIIDLQTGKFIVTPGKAMFARLQKAGDGMGTERKVIVLFAATWLIWSVEFV
jgi:hypothetical protein